MGLAMTCAVNSSALAMGSESAAAAGDDDDNKQRTEVLKREALRCASVAAASHRNESGAILVNDYGVSLQSDGDQKMFLLIRAARKFYISEFSPTFFFSFLIGRPTLERKHTKSDLYRLNVGIVNINAAAWRLC